MELYRDIADTETDALAPIRQALKKAYQNNHIAAGQGAAGAPVVEQGWHPYNMVAYGDGNDGKFYDHAVDGTVASFTTPDFEDGYEYRVILDRLSNSASGGIIRMELYRETDAAYASPDDIAAGTISASQTVVADIHILAPRIASTMQNAIIVSANSVPTAPAVFAAGYHDATVQKCLRARFSWDVNNNDAGAAYLFRRLLPES